jgi:hypothetical protein
MNTVPLTIASHALPDSATPAVRTIAGFPWKKSGI